MPELQIHRSRDRALVRAADAALAPLRWWPTRRPSAEVRRVLLLRLERIGDLLMTLDAIADAKRAWPGAHIDLAVGAWNEPLASLIGDVSTVTVASAPWLARRDAETSWGRLVAAARAWRRARYDVVVNFEPDVRSNLLAWMTGAPQRAGYSSGGGRACLTQAFEYDPRVHVSTQARRLVARAAGLGEPAGNPAPTGARLTIPPDARARAMAVLSAATRPLVGLHASGGRQSKQWHVERFAAVGRRVVQARGGTIVLTGSAADRPLVEAVAAGMPGVPVVDAAGVLDLPALAALLGALDALVTSDTGPMHLAAAMSVPVIALFGPSDPARYGPRAPHERILRVDLPCSPCGQVRMPPERCRGHVPDCMNGITVDATVAATLELLDSARPAVAEPG
jgi:lipopolysaccharide heptosyltransferase II